MKSNKLFFGALTLLAFTACSDDKNTNAPDQVLNDGTESYITVRIFDAFSQTGSRDGETTTPSDYANGGTVTNGNDIYEESEITSLTIAFYDANQKYITVGENVNTLDIKPNQTTGNNLETIAEVEVKLTLKPTDPTPAYAIAFANPVDASEATSLGNVTATQTVERKAWAKSIKPEGADKTTHYFAMNNSVYFDNSGVLQVAVPVSETNFYKSTTSADDKKAIPAVNFYIERIASKVILSGPSSHSSTIDDVTSKATVNGTEEQSVVFVAEKWGLNAIETSSNLMKHFTQNYSTLNSNLTWDTGVIWNDFTNKRSYWTHSRNFTTDLTKFPDVSDDVHGSSSKYPLKYYSYKDLAGNYGTAFGNCLYTFENTKPRAAYAKNSALISAIIIGHYELKDGSNNTIKEGTGDNAKNITFYRRAGAIYTGDNFWNANASVQNLIFTKKTESENETYTALSGETLKSLTMIYHPEKSSLGDRVTENLVSIKLQENVNLDEYYIRTAEGKYSKYTDCKTTWTTDKINAELLRICGTFEAYTNGKAYFNVPIEHLGKLDNGNPSPGYYGVVRNHTYEISIEQILPTAWATGVFEETFPIVPPTITDKYNFKANLNVLAWRMVRKNVTLK